MTLQIYDNYKTNTSRKDFVISTDKKFYSKDSLCENTNDQCYILHKEYHNYDNNDNDDYHIINKYFNDKEITDNTDNIILSKNGKCGFNKDDNNIYKCPPEQCCSNNMCTVDLEQCKTINLNGFETIQKYIENKTILNNTDRYIKDKKDDNIIENIIFYINNNSDLLQLKINKLKNINNKFLNITIKKSKKNYAIRQSNNKIYNNNEIYELINELFVLKTNHNYRNRILKYNSLFYFIIVCFVFYIFFIKK